MEDKPIGFMIRDLKIYGKDKLAHIYIEIDVKGKIIKYDEQLNAYSNVDVSLLQSIETFIRKKVV